MISVFLYLWFALPYSGATRLQYSYKNNQPTITILFWIIYIVKIDCSYYLKMLRSHRHYAVPQMALEVEGSLLNQNIEFMWNILILICLKMNEAKSFAKFLGIFS